MSKPMNEWTDLDFKVDRCEREVAMTTEKLVEEARSLADRMTRLADRLEKDEGATVNSLGEVQGMGREVDRLCAVLASKREARDMMTRVRDRAEG